MSVTDHTRAIDRAVAFLEAAARRQAQRVVEVPGGFAVLNDLYRASYDHNKVLLTSRVTAAAALAAADRVLGEAGHAHRLIEVTDDSVATRCARAFVRAGYCHDVNLIMRHTGAPPDHPADESITVAPLDLDGLRASGRHEWRQRLPHAPETVIDQLVDRRAAIQCAADEVVFLAVVDAQGRVLSRADLYRTGTVAQVEDLMTVPTAAGRGYARAILLDALRRSTRAGCDLSFLVADAQDWPQHFYTRLGYTPIGRTHTFFRPDPKPDTRTGPIG